MSLSSLTNAAARPAALSGARREPVLRRLLAHPLRRVLLLTMPRIHG